MRSDSCQYPINGAPSSSGRRERLGYVRDCKLRSMKLKIRHSDKYRGAAHELRPNPDALSGAKTFKQTARRNPRLSKPSVQTSTPGIGTLTSAFREATAAVRKNKVPLDVKKKKKKNPVVIREKCERVPKTDAGALKTTPPGRTCLWRKLLPPDGLTSPGQLSQGVVRAHPLG